MSDGVLAIYIPPKIKLPPLSLKKVLVVSLHGKMKQLLNIGIKLTKPYFGLMVKDQTLLLMMVEMLQ